MAYAPGQRYGVQERIIRQLALSVKSVRPIAPEAQGASLYDVTLVDGQGSQPCIKIADHYLPIRQHARHLYYEAYDIAKPGKAGYPVHLDAENQWRLGLKVKPHQQQSAAGFRSQRFVSPRLRKAMKKTLTDPHIDIPTLTPPNSQGIARSREGTRYLLSGKQAIKIDKHPLLPHIYMLGPEETDKILCRFDRLAQRFVLVPDEKGYVSSSGFEINYVKAVREAQRHFQNSFLQQSQKIRYREGFRTDEFDDYRQVLEVDSNLRDNIKSILLYGLDEGELALAGKYTGAARELRDGVITAHRYISQVKHELMKGNVEHPLMQRFHEIFTVEPNSDEAEALLATLLRNIEDTGNELSRHISDNCSRIWLVDHDNHNLVGEVYRQDPLKRIFINLKKRRLSI
ncbi:hypothetical protein JZM24_15395 [Candidatus Sodalis endolongispinus]|uniref:Uncharacterized protein n=1 Tax=Candidatus Sodalis endolongispinus TaxID=2812662 RepID=A0ABS5YF55_9GAMM|nr:hypothetical protein [Candidatus Sodalis endolongispinus]MBT9433154.1 hypothetical protein [Candidatus Sodalis endolongispinus]